MLLNRVSGFNLKALVGTKQLLQTRITYIEFFNKLNCILTELPNSG